MLKMSKLALRAGAALFFIGPSLVAAQSVSVTNGAPSIQDFNSLATTGTTNSTLPAGWFLFETGSNANAAYRADNGGDGAGDVYSFGANAATERAFGSIQSGNLVPTIGARLQNDTGAALTSLNIA
jgi:hypothetical protein